MIGIDLSGHLALVTGATGDLGRKLVMTLAQCGADVVVHYHQNQAKAQQLVEQTTSLGRKAIAVQADISDQISIQAMQQQVAELSGDPDIVVTNAVTQYEPHTPVLDQSLADYESQFKTCVLQNVLMAQAFVPAMQTRRWGRFIGMNTECTMQCDPTQSAYVSGKGGMDRLLRVLAKEVGPHNITVNQVAPGWTISDRYRKEGNAKDPAPGYTESLPLKRRAEDQDIANAAVFLASDLAKSITGVYLPVCSGNVMPGV